MSFSLKFPVSRDKGVLLPQDAGGAMKRFFPAFRETERRIRVSPLH